MADTVSTAYDLNLDGQFYDGDTRRIKVKNPKKQEEATWRTQINALGDYIAEKQFLIGDKNAGKFEKFSAANIVWKQTTKFDLTGSLPDPSVSPAAVLITTDYTQDPTVTISNGTPASVKFYQSDSSYNPSSTEVTSVISYEISSNTIQFHKGTGFKSGYYLAYITLANSSTVLQVKIETDNAPT